MKTIDEKAKEYANCVFEDFIESVDFFTSEDIENAILKGVEFAQRWIPVEEELPKVERSGFSDLVLTKDCYDNVKLERYDFELKCFNELRYGFKVTHWRPIELK